jgi:hypothetical protein
MTNFTVRMVRHLHQSSDVKCFDASEPKMFVELLILGNPKFKQTIRGRKFFASFGENPFDNCIAYLGRLLSGKYITDEDYQVSTDVVYRAWRSYDREVLQTGAQNSCSPCARKRLVDPAFVALDLEVAFKRLSQKIEDSYDDSGYAVYVINETLLSLVSDLEQRAIQNS